MKFISPAKINLNLSIIGQRDDGYHTLDTLIAFTKWGDEITIKPSMNFSFTADGPYATIFTDDLLSTNRDSSNLITKAVYLMADKAKCDPKVHVHITKNIPSGYGLGGGSSNAATVMKALNDLWDIGLNMDDFCDIGIHLGAELPVCLHARPCRVTGIGEVIQPTSIEKPLQILIVWPDDHLLTKDVFKCFDRNDFSSSDYTKKNHLTDAAISLCPEIKEILDNLNNCEECDFAQMSGSGSACFGVFNTIESAEKAQSNFKNAVVTTLDA